jgi:hypothetical protein
VKRRRDRVLGDTLRRSRFESLENRQLLAAEVEPNNTIATATFFPDNDQLVGTLSSASDVDYFRFLMLKGERFELDPFNRNAPTFEPTLPPGLELFDDNGNLLATSNDGSDLVFVAPALGFYNVGISSQNAFGTFVGEYGMDTRIIAANTVNEPEPNGPTSEPPLITPGIPINGTLLGTSDIDRFSVNTQPGDVVVVSYAGLTSRGPATQIFDGSGNVIGSDLSGRGLSVIVPQGGLVTIQLQRADSLPDFTLDYVMVAGVFDNSTLANETGSTLSSAHDWQMERPIGENNWQQRASGSLSSIDDIDVFRFELDAYGVIDFELELSGQEAITRSGKTLTLYNSYGQFLAEGTSRFVSTQRPDAFAPGVYYLAVSANSPIGLGAYSVLANYRFNLSPQRDVATHFMDFDGTDPYQGFDRVGPYAVDEAQAYYVGAFDAKLAPYDVNAVLERPVDGNEFVGQGIGDFGDLGAGGWGGGGRGQRASSGGAVTDARETDVGTLSSLRTNTVVHEFGHAVGLPHARDVQSLMSYVGRAELFAAGSIYAFNGTDSRQPGTSVNNQRNFLDWSLQAGAQIIAEENRTADGSEVEYSLDAPLREMSIDHQVTQTLDTREQPVQVVTGDFNNDGTDDVATLLRQTGQLLVYLTGADGQLGAAVTTEVTPNVNFGTEPMSVGDFNNDGRDDIAIGLSVTSSVAILLAGVGGVLAAGTPVPMPGRVVATTVADLNGDSTLDIATVTADGQLNIALGIGSGLFAASIPYATVATPTSLDTGDYDGDGDLDIFVASSTSASVSLHRNLGVGNFTRAGSIEISAVSSGIAVADFNSDTAADFAVISDQGSLLEIYQSFGDGDFGLLRSEPLTNQPQQITTDDIDGDGATDLLIGGWRYSASVLLGDDLGGFTRPIWVGGTQWDELSIAAADLDGNGSKELITVSSNTNELVVSRQAADNPANDKVVVFGILDDILDVDRFTFTPSGETRWDIDIDAAEFQMPVDAILTVRDSVGNVLARNDNATDRQSGIASVDPYIRLDFGSEAFIPAGQLTIEVTGRNGSSGAYRLKLTPGRAMETGAPRVIAVYPDNGARIDATNQIVVLLDDIIDPSSIDSSSVRVTNAAGQRVSGSARINPLDSTLLWTALAALPVDTYTLTLSGIRDFNGNVLDGEVDGAFAFPLVSGNGVAGGAFTSSFTVTATDTTPADVFLPSYERDPYQRGRFTLPLTDQLSMSSVRDASFTLRGAGADGVFATTDDTFRSLDALYDSFAMARNAPLSLYTRGIPDSGQYQIEATVMDGAGHLISIAESVFVAGVVPASALSIDVSRTVPGLLGSYVNSSLRAVTDTTDWRATQTIVGTRTDSTIDFEGAGSFGVRAGVGVTNGASDANWDNFSVQWDGYITVPAGGAQLVTRSDDSSRMWVDLDRNGVFGNIPGELADNLWGTSHPAIYGTPTTLLPAGTYPIRVQYEEGAGNETMLLEWIRPNRALDVGGLVHGPNIVGTSIASGTHVTDTGLDGSPGQRLTSYSVTFSGAINPATLTTENLRLIRSDDANFFDPLDEVIEDADGVIQWDPNTFTATLTFATPLRSGFYLFEANGETGGITNTVGTLLDGEFLSNHIVGNFENAIWKHTPSGDGIPGGTYRSTFSYSPPRLAMTVEDAFISENGGSTTVTLSRLFADTTLPMVVTLGSSDRTELSVPPNVTIPAGSSSVTFTVNALDDTIFDGTQFVSITARSNGIESGDVELGVTDFEAITLTLTENTISERGGVTELILTRSDASTSQIITLRSDDTTEAVLPPSVTFAVGERSVSVPVTAVDDEVLDGSQFVSLIASGTGLVDSSVTLEVSDFETLVLELNATSMSERDGVITGVLRRSDPTSRLFAQVFSDPSDALSRQVTVEFPAGRSTSVPFQLNARDNQLIDGTRTVSIIAAAGGYERTGTTIQITDYEPLSIVYVDPLPGPPSIDPATGAILPGAAPEISELDGVATIRLQRTDTRGALEATLAVDPANGVSFASAVQFADGARLSAPVLISAVDDDLLTGTRAFTLTATAPAYIDAIGGLRVSDYEELTTQIVNRSGAAIVDNTVSEDSEPVFLRVTLPRAVTVAHGPLTLVLSTTSPQSIDLPATATIRPGDLFVDVPINIIDNDIVGGNRTFSIVADAAGYVSSDVGMTVTEDDVPTLIAALQYPPSQPGASSGTIPENGGRATLVLTRNTIAETTVRLGTSPTEQLQWPESIVFPRGFRRIEVPITTINNGVVDGFRAVTMTVRATGHPEVSLATDIVDDEVAGLVLTDSSGRSIASGMRLTEAASPVLNVSSQNVSVSLAAAPRSPVRLRVNANERLNLSTSELLFTPSNWNVPQEVRVSVLDDRRTTGNQNVNLAFEVILDGTDPGFRNLRASVINVEVVDDDEPSITIVETLGNTYASELGLVDTFSVKLDTQPTKAVTLTFDNSAINSVAIVPNSIVFTPQNWDVPQTLSVETDLDFNADGHDIGLIFIDVSSAGGAVGYPDIGRRRLSVVHVDTELSDLHVRRVGDDVLLVDETTDVTLLKQPLFGGIFQTGSRSERLTIDPGTGYDTIQLNTFGGDDTIVIGGTARVNIDGSTGYDTLKLELPGFFFTPSVFPAANNPVAVTARNIEEINTIGNGIQTLVINSDAVRVMTDERNDLFLRVDTTDVLQLGDEWTVQVPEFRDGVPAHRLTSNNTTLRLVAGATWQNPLLAADVNRSGSVSSLDPLLIINRINEGGEGELPQSIDELTANDQLFYYDVSGDGVVSALDALQAINYLNSLDQDQAAAEPIEASADLFASTSIVVSPLPTTDVRRFTDWDSSIGEISSVAAKTVGTAVAATDELATNVSRHGSSTSLSPALLDEFFAADEDESTTESLFELGLS